MTKKLLLFFLFFSACLLAFAQNRELNGKVILSKDKTPLPGVSVFIKGTAKGAATASNGVFTLRIPAGATVLQVRSIGYVTREISVAEGQTSVIIELAEDNTQLGGVVVTGYSSKKQG
ncbi:MAG: SusC/RagA family TonB-linked outer membrane protein, partial [Sphingobacteriaceae bacterium]